MTPNWPFQSLTFWNIKPFHEWENNELSLRNAFQDSTKISDSPFAALLQILYVITNRAES